MARISPALVLACLTILPACASGDGMQEKLRDASTVYNRSLRWGDIDRAAEHLPAEAQQAFLEKHESVSDELVIVDYELTRLDLDKETGVAASRAEITWHTQRSTIVKATTVDQLWQFHDGRFVLVDERRSAGTPLAIFAEREEDPHPYLPGIRAYRRQHEIGQENKKKRRSKKKKDEARPGPAADLAASAGARGR